MNSEPVRPEVYTEDYYAASCGGAEFYKRYGPRVPKPQLVYALRLAGVQGGERVLDLGCGRGELLYHAEREGAQAVGTDYAAAALGTARRDGGKVLRCDAKSLPFERGSFDCAFLLGVVDHLHDWELEACFKELERVLRAGGRVVLHTCTNRLHYKTLTYSARRALARGLGLREPRPPRSGEDEAMHVNEHSGKDLERFFARLGWAVEVRAMPNYKALVGELYPSPLPEGFPLRSYPAWRAALAKALARGPLSAWLAREFFAVVRPPSKSL